MSGCEPSRGQGVSREYLQDFGGASGKARPVVVSERVVVVTDVEEIAARENDGRRNLVIQNIGADPVQVYVTNGLRFLGGGLIIAGQDLTATPPKIGGVWSAHQDGVGVIQKNVFVRCAAGDASVVSVNEES